MSFGQTTEPHPIRRPFARAFTLIELLVVIAIISLLVSILLPSLNKAKLLARRVLCSTNLKNCGTILHMYSTEHSSLVPPGLRGNYMPSIFYKNDAGNIEDFRLWFEDAGYEEIFGVLLCPGCKDVVPINDPANTAPACYMTYFYFPNRLRPNFGTPDAVPTNVLDLADGQYVVMQDQILLDQFDIYRFGHPDRGDTWDEEEDTRPSTGWWYGDDGRGANLMYMDGSVNFHDFNSLWDVGDTSSGAAGSGIVTYYSQFPSL